MKPLCPTVHTGAINSVLANYEVLCDALCKINKEGRDEYAMKAGGILNAMEKFCTFFGLHLSHQPQQNSYHSVSKVKILHTTMQYRLLNLLEMQRSDEGFNHFYDRLIETSKELTSDPSLPRYAKRPRRIDDGEPAH